MRDLKRLALAAALALATGTTLAGVARADNVQDRLENQQDRIQEGRQNGSLTKSEAQRLRQQDAKIRQERKRLAKNGLSQHDRQVLKRDLNHESDQIYDQRHDDQRR